LNYGKDLYPPFCEAVRDWDQLPSPYHLIPFERQPSGDIELVLEEPPPIPENLLEQFREIVREHIRVPQCDKRFLDDVDTLRFTGSATSFDPSKNKRVPKTAARINQRGQFRTSSNFIYDYVKVDKAPHESRECVVPNPETLNMTSLLELQMEQVISSKWDKIRETNFDWLPDWLSMYSKHLFILSDQKKCGLTFPRRLIIEFYRVLNETFPDWDFGLAEGLLDSYINYNGQMRQMRGGPGLGQFNKTISVIVALLFEIWRRDQDPEWHLSGLFYNDDQVIRFTFLEGRVEPLPQRVTDGSELGHAHGVIWTSCT
jgi:hypothetical protein